jgi:hypothetical protein
VGPLGGDSPSTLVANGTRINHNQPALGGEMVANEIDEMGGIGGYAGCLVGLFVGKGVGGEEGEKEREAFHLQLTQ